MNTSERIWKEYHSRLHAFVMSRVSDDSASDDILQNVFLKMDSGLASLRDKTKLESWLYQITRNAIVDYLRSQKPTVELTEEFPQAEVDDSEEAAQRLSQCLPTMVNRLPEIYREAITLSELNGLSQRDVALIQGISLSGAKSRIQRGRARLKKMMTDCCWLEFDHRGKLCGYEKKSRSCTRCC